MVARADLGFECYKLVTSISLEPSRTELKRRLDFMVVHHGLHSVKF